MDAHTTSSWIADVQGFFRAYAHLGILGLGHSTVSAGGRFDFRFGRRDPRELSKMMETTGIRVDTAKCNKARKRRVRRGKLCTPEIERARTVCASPPDAVGSHNARTDMDKASDGASDTLTKCAPIPTRANAIARSCGAPNVRFHFATRVAGPNEGGSAPVCIRLNALRSAGGIDHLAHKRGSGAWASCASPP